MRGFWTLACILLLTAACESNAPVTQSVSGRVTGLPPAVVHAIQDAHPGSYVRSARYELGVWNFALIDRDERYLMRVGPTGEVLSDDAQERP